jgi:hypothetical protein
MTVRHRPALLAGLAGALVGVVVSALLVTAWRDEPVVTDGPEAASAFLDAWERSRLETYYVRSEVMRTTPNGELESELEVAQRPPDVVRRQYGGLWGRQGDRTISCAVDPKGGAPCGPGEETRPPYEEEVADEVARLEAYVVGSHPLYRVTTTGDGCFDLVLTQLFPDPSYGTDARFCFDDETGAMISNRIVREEGTEVMEAVEVRAEVDERDLALVS